MHVCPTSMLKQTKQVETRSYLIRCFKERSFLHNSATDQTMWLCRRLGVLTLLILILFHGVDSRKKVRSRNRGSRQANLIRWLCKKVKELEARLDSDVARLDAEDQSIRDVIDEDLRQELGELSLAFTQVNSGMEDNAEMIGVLKKDLMDITNQVEDNENDLVAIWEKLRSLETKLKRRSFFDVNAKNVRPRQDEKVDFQVAKLNDFDDFDLANDWYRTVCDGVYTFTVDVNPGTGGIDLGLDISDVRQDDTENLIATKTSAPDEEGLSCTIIRRLTTNSTVSIIARNDSDVNFVRFTGALLFCEH